MGGIGLGIGIGRIMQNPSPLQIQGLQAWYEADSPNSFVKDGSNYVSTWKDKSGKGHDLTQSTASSQPLLQINSLNPNLYSVLFDGVNDYLKTLTFPLIQPFTIWVIFKQTILNPQSDTYIFDGYSSTTILYYDHGNAKYRIYAGTAYPNSPYPFDGNYKFAKTIFNGPSSKIIVNEEVGVGDAGANNANGFTLGNDKTGNVPSNITVYAVIIKQGVSTPYEDQLVKNYIKRKLNIPGL